MIPVKLLLEVALKTEIIAASIVVSGIYLLRKEVIGLEEFIFLWIITGVIILLLMLYYVGPKFKAYIESLPKHETGI